MQQNIDAEMKDMHTAEVGHYDATGKIRHLLAYEAAVGGLWHGTHYFWACARGHKGVCALTDWQAATAGCDGDGRSGYGATGLCGCGLVSAGAKTPSSQQLLYGKLGVVAALSDEYKSFNVPKISEGVFAALRDGQGLRAYGHPIDGQLRAFWSAERTAWQRCIGELTAMGAADFCTQAHDGLKLVFAEPDDEPTPPDRQRDSEPGTGPDSPRASTPATGDRSVLETRSNPRRSSPQQRTFTVMSVEKADPLSHCAALCRLCCTTAAACPHHQRHCPHAGAGYLDARQQAKLTRSVVNSAKKTCVLNVSATSDSYDKELFVRSASTSGYAAVLG
eukprot:COSAG01_NODE_1945_length_8831_cov_4.250000_11_plen_334_part_00